MNRIQNVFSRLLRLPIQIDRIVAHDQVVINIARAVRRCSAAGLRIREIIRRPVIELYLRCTFLFTGKADPQRTAVLHNIQVNNVWGIVPPQRIAESRRQRMSARGKEHQIAKVGDRFARLYHHRRIYRFCNIVCKHKCSFIVIPCRKGRLYDFADIVCRHCRHGQYAEQHHQRQQDGKDPLFHRETTSFFGAPGLNKTHCVWTSPDTKMARAIFLF